MAASVILKLHWAKLLGLINEICKFTDNRTVFSNKHFLFKFSWGYPNHQIQNNGFGLDSRLLKRGLVSCSIQYLWNILPELGFQVNDFRHVLALRNPFKLVGGT